MAEQLITCPNCGSEFEVGDVLTGAIRSQLRNELEAELVEKEKAVTKRLKEAKRLERSLAEREEAVDEAVAERLEKERRSVAATERKRAEKHFKSQVDDLQEQVDERSKKLEEANKRERKLLRLQRELQEKEKAMDLEVDRRVTEAQKKLSEEALKKAQEAQQLKIRERDVLIKGLQDRVADLQRRMEQGSQEAQGEALEGQLLDLLSGAFPFDLFDEVKKGARGADIVQTVRDGQGRVCGKILWEAKNAKTFQNVWIEKLKRDQMEAGATLAVLMSVQLPPGIRQFGQPEEGGVWITEYGSAIGLCAALREQLTRVTRERMMVQHREGVRDILFEYVTGQEFNLRVRAIADAYIQMQQDLESEKRAFYRQWKKREKQIARVLDNIAGMHGELEGMVGPHTALPAVETLSLEHISADDGDDGD